MDEAAVSKWEPERLQRILSDLPRMEREGKQALAADGAGDEELCLLELYPDRTLGLVSETESGEKKGSGDGGRKGQPGAGGDGVRRTVPPSEWGRMGF